MKIHDKLSIRGTTFYAKILNLTSYKNCRDLVATNILAVSHNIEEVRDFVNEELEEKFTNKIS